MSQDAPLSTKDEPLFWLESLFQFFFFFLIEVFISIDVRRKWSQIAFD